MVRIKTTDRAPLGPGSVLALPCSAKFLPLVAVVLLAVTEPCLAAGGTLYDPMRPQAKLAVQRSASIAESAQKFHLQAVVVADKRCSAVINGTSVVEGDHFKGYLVEKIDATGVLLAGAHGHKRLIMQEGAAKMRVRRGNSDQITDKRSSQRRI